jgi:4-hydroxythreonine-4-phosphate dehydrogenase
LNITDPSRPLVVSLGDPAGVGPELVAEAWSQREREALRPFAVAGGVRLLGAAAASRGLAVPIEPVASLTEAAAVFGRALPVIGALDGPWRPAEPDREGAALALGSLRQASELAVSGEAAGLVTGPIAKALLG